MCFLFTCGAVEQPNAQSPDLSGLPRCPGEGLSLEGEGLSLELLK